MKRRAGLAILVGTSLFAAAQVVLAATPGTPPPVDEIQPGPNYLALALIGGAGVAIVVGAWLSATFRRVLAWSGLVLLFSGGLLYVAAGFFGDFSGQHRIFIGPVALGVGMIALSLVGVIWLRRRWRRRPDPQSNV